MRGGQHWQCLCALLPRYEALCAIDRNKQMEIKLYLWQGIKSYQYGMAEKLCWALLEYNGFPTFI